MRTLHRVALATTLSVFFLISVGGFVRAAGAGLGCEDWPRCFPWSWLPPRSAADIPPDVDPTTINIAKAWIEYVNRLIGVAVGFLVIATTLVAWRRGTRRMAWTATAALLLTGFQGWLGGKVVHLKLEPWLVTAHLLLALVIAALLVHLTERTRAADASPAAELAPARRRLRIAAWGAFVLLGVQVLVGAYVRGTIDAEAARLPDAPRAEWLRAVGVIDFVHRDLGVATALAVGVVFLLARRLHGRGEAPLRRLAGVAVALALAQIAAGVTLAYGGLPPAAQLVHLTLGAWLFGVLFLLALLARRWAGAATRPAPV